jgi:ketosteroid isomerase-like protein
LTVPPDQVEIVRRFLEGAQRDPDAVWDAFAETVEWETGPLQIPGVPPMAHGPAGVRDFFRRWVGIFEDWGYEVEELIGVGEAVVAQIHQWGRGKGSGVVVDQHFWQIYTVRDAEIVRVTHRHSRGEALRAAEAGE